MPRQSVSKRLGCRRSVIRGFLASPKDRRSRRDQAPTATITFTINGIHHTAAAFLPAAPGI